MRLIKSKFFCFFGLLLTLGAMMPAMAKTIMPAVPEISGRAYVLVDYDSGRVLAEKAAHERMEPASLTKVMTVYIVLQEIKAGKLSLSDKVHISEKAWRTGGSRSFVKVNTQIELDTLLKGLIVQSGNDATVALAEHVGGSEEVFATIMNETAAKLGMKNTNFTNSTGLPGAEHYTTAYDMAILTKALIRDFPEHYSWYSIKEFSHNGITQKNRNKLLWMDDSVDGVKTGHTNAAGYCLISSAQKEGMRLISVLMGSASETSRARDSQKLLGYGFRFFETHKLYSPGQALTDARVWKGAVDSVKLGINDTVYVTIPRGEHKSLKASMQVQPKMMAPIGKGQQYGTMRVVLGEETLLEKPLIALQDVPEGGFFSRLVDDAMLMLE